MRHLAEPKSRPHVNRLEGIRILADSGMGCGVPEGRPSEIGLDTAKRGKVTSRKLGASYRTLNCAVVFVTAP